MRVRKAAAEDFPAVISVYWDIIESLEGREYTPLWEKEVYPTSEMIKELIDSGELYVMEEEQKGRIAGVMGYNGRSVEGYENVKWRIQVSDTDARYIHVFGIHPDYEGQGIGTAFIEEMKEIGKSAGAVTIRLDVLEGNIPARALYEKTGFVCMGNTEVYYEDTGLIDLVLYEFLL